MCGFAGGLNTSLATAEAMADVIAYRGPDERTNYFDRDIAMAHQRLSIVGMADGHQPFFSHDRSIVCVFNGEIYNHQELRARLKNRYEFRSGSDGEVIIPLYLEMGDAFSRDLRGMFSIAIWDTRKRRLLLTVDRMGIKPLFYAQVGRSFLFGSEIKALLKHPGVTSSIDWQTALAEPWLAGVDSFNSERPQSFFRDIKILPAGTTLTVDADTLVPIEQKYWNLFDRLIDTSRSQSDFVEEYGDLLASSVRECLMGEARVGVFLSGGIDSAAIAAQVHAAGVALETFTVVNDATRANGDAEGAAAIAKHFGFRNHQIEIEPSFNADEWKRLLRIVESPYCSPDQYFKFKLHQAAKNLFPDLKVILSGQGSDEFNGGYSVGLSRQPERGWSSFESTLRNMGLFTMNDQTSDAELFTEYRKTKLRDLQMYNLWTEDRVAAGNSIETRVPFLDHRVVELLARVPYASARELFWDKFALRQALKPVLAEEFRARRKVPFYFGDGEESVARGIVKMLPSLIIEAFPSGGDHIKKMIAGPSITRANWLTALRLVNLGLLEKYNETLA